MRTGLLSIAVVAVVAAVACREPAPPAAARIAAAAPIAIAGDAGSVAPDALVAARPSSAEACADAWLQARGLNAYGDPPDTAYAGGTPLFDERTGARKDRLQHLLGKLPALRTACGSPDAG